MIATQAATEQPTPPAKPAPLTAATPLPPLVVEERAPQLASALAPEATSNAKAIRLEVSLTFLHVQVPRAAGDQVRSVWSHLREDAFDAATALRLERNGLRVGIGKEQWWDAIQTALNAIDGVRSLQAEPVHVPPAYPLALELDTEARDQTLFHAREDGSLTGETWRQSRNVLRVSYDLNLEKPDSVRLAIVPEVRQHMDGFKWVRSAAGMAKLPNYAGRAFATASFRVELRPGEFLLVAAGERAEAYGLIGSRFMVHDDGGQRYDSYVFLRADVNHVAQRY